MSCKNCGRRLTDAEHMKCFTWCRACRWRNIFEAWAFVAGITFLAVSVGGLIFLAGLLL